MATRRRPSGHLRLRPPRPGPRTVAGALVAAACALLSPADSGARPAALATACDRDKVRNVLQLASPDDQEVVVNCDLDVPAGFVITKRLVVRGSEGSGVTIDCHGATINGSIVPQLAEGNARKDMILIRSSGQGNAESGSWSRPTDVTVRNCKVIGAVRILGMTYRTGSTDIQESSYRAGHAGRMRRIAPTRITFDDLTVTGRARSPVYFGVGVTRSALIDSELKGEAESVALYLDAESGQNLIKRNYIHTVTPREVLAIDASSHNKILDNRFSALSNGGIYLYRNCGERGVVRHTTPRQNTIVNNVFYYKNYNPRPPFVNPSVYMGSRNGSPGYCDDDDAQDIGSGASNLDFARNNVVMQNQIYKLAVDLMIREGRSTDSPNYVDHNTTVTTPVQRRAGCHVPNGFFKQFILDGESIVIFRRPSGARYVGPRRVCDDGDLTRANATVRAATALYRQPG